MQQRTKMHLLLFFGIFILLNFLTWISTNYQLMEDASHKKAMIACLVLSIPISILAFHGTRIGYNHFGSAWSVRLAAFGISYSVFPFMTYFFLRETPFSFKTMTCILLSVTIICIQVFWPDN